MAHILSIAPTNTCVYWSNYQSKNYQIKKHYDDNIPDSDLNLLIKGLPKREVRGTSIPHRLNYSNDIYPETQLRR